MPFAGQLHSINADPGLVKFVLLSSFLAFLRSFPSALYRAIDQMSLADRIRQVEAGKLLTDRQLAFVIPLFLLCSGGNVENSSLLEAIRVPSLLVSPFLLLAHLLSRMSCAVVPRFELDLPRCVLLFSCPASVFICR
jgi:hypothetical protein